MSMPTSRSLSRLFAVLLSAAMVFSLAACSGDDSDDTTNGDATEETSAGDAEDDAVAGDAVAGDDDAAATSEDEDDSRAFDVDDDGLAAAMQSGTGADDVEVDGNTFRLNFNDGSVDDVTSSINCRAMNEVKGADDQVVLVYPDGEVNCDES